jgi:hypothetical protein
MPIETSVGLTPVASVTPVQFFCDDVTCLFISGTVTVNIGGADPATYDAVDAGSAANIIQQINNAMNSDKSVPLVITDTSTTILVWSSITPNPQAVFQPFSPVIFGTGFLASGITYLKLDNSAGQVAEFVAVISSDISMTSGTSISLNVGSPPNYTLYYTTDPDVNTTNWTTTGLTVTAT